jgi:predicted dehydrogenase
VCEHATVGAGGDLRLVLIGAGWIVPYHLAALDRLGRTTLVGVAASRLERAAAVAEPRGAVASTDPVALIDEVRPDAAFVCVPPWRAVAIGEALVERGIPFLTEKPLAATDADGPVRLAAAIERSGLVVAVGYHLRALEGLDELRGRLATDPPRLVIGRWLDSTPAAPWWRHAATGGGQVVEQATHLYDLGRALVGEASVVGATSVHDGVPDPEDGDVADATVALLRYETGALGTFLNSRRSATPTVELELIGDAGSSRIRRLEGPAGWEISLVEGASRRRLPLGRDPYEVQDDCFLDAVVAGDPLRVLSSYGDALATDRLTRAVVAATGQPG